METATQTLHRLTSFAWDWYEPSREDDDLVWSVPVDDPRVVRDLQTNDIDRFPWFFKRYVMELPRVPLPRTIPALAYALGASASEMTFIDSEVPRLLGEPLDGLLFTCVGVPGYTSAAGSPPLAPTAIR